MPTLPSRIAIVGLGLMGGSLAYALKAQGVSSKIIGITRTRATLDNALQRGAIDVASDRLSAARGADMIVLGAPVRTILQQIPQLGEIASDGALIIDMGSTKREIVRAMNELPERLFAVGAHPMCGKESAGFDVAEPTLYQGKVFVITQTARSSPAALAQTRLLAETIGSRVIPLDAERHDRIVASISHMPYIVASALTGTVAELGTEEPLVWELASSGFRDTSRLAASDTQMMLDILLTNSENVADVLRLYSRRFADLADAIYDNDEPTLRPLLEDAAQARRAWHAGE